MYGMAAKPRIHLITPARSTYHPVNEHGDVHLPPLALFIRLGYICGKPIKNTDTNIRVYTGTSCQLLEEDRVVSILFPGFWEIWTMSLRICSISSLLSDVRTFRVTADLSALVRGSSMVLDMVL